MNDPCGPIPAAPETAPVDWAQALAEHHGWLRRVVAARLGEPRAVDDVMQDVALAAVRQQAPLRNPARAAAWLYRLAVRHVLMYRRRAGRGRSFLKRYAGHGGWHPPDHASPLGWLLSDERQKLVQDALKRLPERDAQILMLKHTEGFSAREIADRLGTAVNTIEARLSRARKRLREELRMLVTDHETQAPEPSRDER